MELNFQSDNDVTTAEVSGRIDGMTAKDFEVQVIEAVTNPGSVLICDFSGVSYISSAGLRSVLIIAKRFSTNNGMFFICGHTGPVAEVFRVSGFERVISMHTTREDALAEAGI